jgi:hypothetical protein
MSDLDTTEIRKAYWTHVRGLAEAVQETIEESPYADVHDITHDVVDGSEWAIYTGKAILALYCSDQSADHYIEDFGVLPVTGSDPCALCHRDKRVDSLDFSALAYSVIRADVTEMLGSLDRGKEAIDQSA